MTNPEKKPIAASVIAKRIGKPPALFATTTMALLFEKADEASMTM